MMQNSSEPLVLTDGLAIDAGPRGGRVPFDTDPVLAAWCAGPLMPAAGQSLGDSNARWEPVKAGADGGFTRRGGYLWLTHDSPSPRTVLLAARGHGLVYVNGQPRAGDPYGYGWLLLPVRLNAGVNTFLFAIGRGTLRAELRPAPERPALHGDDLTLPDFVLGEGEELWAAAHILNPSVAPGRKLTIRASVGGRSATTELPTVPALSVRKCGFRIPVPAGLKAGVDAPVTVTLVGHDKAELSSRTIPLRVREPRDSVKRTFVSNIDGSVQYYGVRAAQRPDRGNALVLTLHGASVEGIGQIDAYGPKSWATLVGPTNRRPYGFDWEDWGRLDALEVLDEARKRYPNDPARTCLTGHSMGGHGTWSIGSLFPDRFAAIAPSAGWISFATYTRTPVGQGTPLADPVAEAVRRAVSPCDTLLRTANLLETPIYVLHGDADDNVPVTEARQMRAALEAAGHKRVLWHEQPGAGHWWDASDDPGADCVDWKPLFALFERSRIADHPTVEFTTPNPAVSARCDWATVVQQQRSMAPTRIELAFAAGAVTGRTENALRLALDPAHLPGPIRRVEVDGARIEVRDGHRIVHLLRAGDSWRQAPPPKADEKRPERSGPFKQAFSERMIFVFGTMGGPDETAWTSAKARYDAESWLYRGNGAVDVVADREASGRLLAGRSVILYGNADTNRLWGSLLHDSPIEVRRNRVRVGTETRTGSDLAALFLRPRRDSDRALVGVVAPTGPNGARLAERLPYFTSGVAYPDWCVASSRVFREGVRGVLGAGYFGPDWRLETGEAHWRMV